MSHDAENAERAVVLAVAVRKFELGDAVEKLWAEYEMIQKKLDAYTDYPFKLKAASVTLTAGFWAGGKLADFSWHFFLVALLIPPIFRLLEVHHERVKRVLGGRAIALERFMKYYCRLKTLMVFPIECADDCDVNLEEFRFWD